MFYQSLTMALIFFIFSTIFFIFKEKSAFLIGGYNNLSQKQKKNFDKLKMSQDFAVMFFKYSLIFFIGAIGCITVTESSFWIAFIIWIIYFAKQLKSHNTFLNKYKLK